MKPALRGHKQRKILLPELERTPLEYRGRQCCVQSSLGHPFYMDELQPELFAATTIRLACQFGWDGQNRGISPATTCRIPQ